jgi:hypothetical protein
MFSLRPARGQILAGICSLLIAFFSTLAFSQAASFFQAASWSFAVSGDSRNCGNVVMPAIAAGVIRKHSAFYWHLGDLRAIYAPDEDYQHEPEHRGQPLDKAQYLKAAWDDYIQNQLSFFHHMPVFVGIGNHELIRPKTREEFITQFGRWLDSPALQKQRLADQSQDVKTYYHWIQGGVDFIYLDNASPEQFDSVQMAWFDDVLRRATVNSDVRAVVVGMHEALPDSLAASHSMNDFPVATASGREAYTALVHFREQTQKHVYILASHSHFYMSGIFDSDYWRAHGGVLPGWIIGTGGAMRYPLPPDASRAQEAREKVYGYLLAKVHPDGSIDFNFREVTRKDVPHAVSKRYTPQFADYCFNENADFKRADASH